ncbi:putative acetate permease [Burkholderia pseudomallei MSHR4377]|nr:putative acetate permease [Burkholderia pseudomallei MSHR4377]
MQRRQARRTSGRAGCAGTGRASLGHRISSARGTRSRRAGGRKAPRWPARGRSARYCSAPGIGLTRAGARNGGVRSMLGSALRCFGASALRCFGVSAFRRFGVSALRRFGASALRRFGASALRRFGASALRRFGASAQVSTPLAAARKPFSPLDQPDGPDPKSAEPRSATHAGLGRSPDTAKPVETGRRCRNLPRASPATVFVSRSGRCAPCPSAARSAPRWRGASRTDSAAHRPTADS